MRASHLFQWIWFPGLVLLSYGLTRWCSVGGVIDLLSTGRIRLGKQALAEYGVGIFGRPVITHGVMRSSIDSYFVIDSGMLSGLITFGSLTMIVFAFAYFLVQRKLVLDGEYFRLMVLWIVMLSGLSDPWINDWSYNIFIVLFTQIPWATNTINDATQNILILHE
jgi:hypothetical protein